MTFDEFARTTPTTPGAAPVAPAQPPPASSASTALPVPPDLDALFSKYSTEFGVDPNLARAVGRQESNFNPQARSPKGALGVMQLMPQTAAELGVDPADPEQNIKGGIQYLSQQLQAAGGDRNKALARYNFGPGNVERGRPYPPETQQYITKVNQYAGAPPAPPQPEKTVPTTFDQYVRAQNPPPKLMDWFSHPERAVSGAVDLGKRGVQFVREHPDEAARLGVEAVGMGVGSMVAPEFGVPATAARVPFWLRRLTDLSKMGGAGLGAAGGSAASETFDPSGSPKEAIEKAERAAEGGAIGEGLGRSAKGILEFLAAPYGNRLIPDARDVRNTLETARRPNETATIPAYIYRDTPTANMIDRSLGRAIGGGGIEKGRQLAVNISQREVKNFPEQFGQVGELAVDRNRRMQHQMASALEAFKQQANQAYAYVDQLNAQNPVFVDLEPVKMMAAARWFEAKMGRLNPATTETVNDILSRGTPNGQGASLVPFEEAHRLRSDLRRTADPTGATQGQTEALAESLAGAIDQQMDTAAMQMNPALLAAYRRANAMYKGTPQQPGMQQFDTPLMTKLLDREKADAFTSTMFQRDRPIRSDVAMKLAPGMIDDFRRAYAEHLSMEMGANPTGAKIQEVLYRQGQNLELVLGKRHADDLRHLADVLNRAEAHVAGGDKAQTALRLGQGSLLVSMAFSNPAPLRTGGLLVVPGALAWAINRPVIAHWLSIGLNLPPGSREFTRWTGRLIGLLRQDNIPFAEVPAEWANQMLEAPTSLPPAPPGPVAPPPTDTTASAQPARTPPVPPQSVSRRTP